MAIKAQFFPRFRTSCPCSTTLGDNTIIVSRDAAGNILVNGGAVAVTGGGSPRSPTPR